MTSMQMPWWMLYTFHIYFVWRHLGVIHEFFIITRETVWRVKNSIYYFYHVIFFFPLFCFWNWCRPVKNNLHLIYFRSNALNIWIQQFQRIRNSRCVKMWFVNDPPCWRSMSISNWNGNTMQIYIIATYILSKCHSDFPPWNQYVCINIVYVIECYVLFRISNWNSQRLKWKSIEKVVKNNCLDHYCVVVVYTGVHFS